MIGHNNMRKTVQILLMLSFFIANGYAKGPFKRYSLKSGMILYDINTTGISPGLTTHTVGVARLVFDNWGARELKEDDATEIQSGDFNEENARHTMSKFDYGTIYTVDYDDNVTYQTRDTTIDIAIAKGADMSNENVDILKEMKATQIGTDVVAGYKCDLWKTKDQTICLYKGIPLKVSIETAGFSSTRTAQMVMFDKPISESEFKLPGFAVMIDADYTSNASAATRTEDYIASVEELSHKMKAMGLNLSEENVSLDENQENEIINTLGERYLAKQKKLLPKLMVELKGARECMDNAEDTKEASNCIKAANKIDEKLGDKTSHYDYSNWNKDKKEAIVKDIDTEITNLKVTIDCVKDNNKTTDVIICTDGSLKAQE